MDRSHQLIGNAGIQAQIGCIHPITHQLNITDVVQEMDTGPQVGGHLGGKGVRVSLYIYPFSRSDMFWIGLAYGLDKDS